jgi:hypothetical protein
VVLGVVPVPAIPLPIVVQGQVQLRVLIRSHTRTRELGSHFSGPLVGKNEAQMKPSFLFHMCHYEHIEAPLYVDRRSGF